MRTLSVAGLIVLSACGALGCRKSEAVTTAASTSSAASVVEVASNDARAVALAKVKGEGGANVLVEMSQRALEKNPRKVDWWIALGRAWVRKARESSDPGYHVNARAAAEVALELEPSNKSALALSGLVLLNDHKFEDARTLAEKMLATDAEDPQAYGVLSDALLELGRYEEAMVAAQKMVDLKPNLPSYSRASHLQWVKGDIRAARESIRLAIDAGRDRKDPEPQAWTLVQAATMFWHLGDLEGAEAGFDKALDWVSEYPPALVGKGRVALARAENARAAELFGRAYKASPLVETAWLMGDAKAALGDALGAEVAYALVEKTGRASDPRALSQFLSAKWRSIHLALELAEAESRSRGDIATLDTLAWALYRAGQFERAKQVIDRAARFGTKEPALLFHRGAIHIAAGDVVFGRKLITEALAQSAWFDASGAREARALLEASANKLPNKEKVAAR